MPSFDELLGAGNEDWSVDVMMISINFLAGLVSIRGNEGVDGEPFVVGLATVLRQYHQDHTLRFLQLLAQCVTSYAAHAAAK